ncbi:MAG: YgaP-like transmembrane domain [Limisphaerales bacterium]
MKSIFKPNISGKGRIVRGIIAVILLGIAIFASEFPAVARWSFAAGGVFVAFEALRGWCALRACGVKTRL